MRGTGTWVPPRQKFDQFIILCVVQMVLLELCPGGTWISIPKSWNSPALQLQHKLSMEFTSTDAAEYFRHEFRVISRRTFISSNGVLSLIDYLLSKMVTSDMSLHFVFVVGNTHNWKVLLSHVVQMFFQSKKIKTPAFLRNTSLASAWKLLAGDSSLCSLRKLGPWSVFLQSAFLIFSTDSRNAKL